MKFVQSHNSQQLPLQQQASNYFPPTNINSANANSTNAMNNLNNANAITNGPSSIMNNTNHIPHGMNSGMSGMSSYSGASSSPHPPPHPSSDSVLSSSSSSGVGAPMTSGMMSSTEGSGGDAGAASSSSGAFGAASGCSSSSLANQLGDPSTVLLTKKRLQDLVKEIDPTEVLDDDVEDVLLQIADDFIENVVTSGCQMAKHRKSSTLEVKDVQLHLQRNWNMWIPGFGSEELRPYKKAPVTDAHKQRLALIKKTLKKF